MGAAALTLLAAAACSAPPVEPLEAPKARPAKPAQARPERSEASLALTRYYGLMQKDLQARGLLRTDAGGKDVPFSRRDLVENFIRIALYDEYVVQSDSFVARQQESSLRRWTGPIRMKLIFGASVSETQRREDRAEVTRYAARLQQLTGHPIRVTDGAANYFVLVMNTDEQAAFGERLQELVPGIDTAPVREITAMPRSIFCSVYAFATSQNPSVYISAVAVIRAEHPDLLRQSCFHEELAQGLGLPNDSPMARPTIFNDDEEFALLTRHDELLLQILYDPRLRPGMTEAEARPIVEDIALELLGGDS